MESGHSVAGKAYRDTPSRCNASPLSHCCSHLLGAHPLYVWGDAHGVEARLIDMVPLGSPPAQLEGAAKQRSWNINQQNIRSLPAGSETFMHDTHRDCRSRGGLVVPIILARYSAPFDTYVESFWLFDPKERLRGVCVRKTVDAL